MFFGATSKDIDKALYTSVGCNTTMDCVDQSSWILFLKHLDGLERTREQAAELEGKNFEHCAAELVKLLVKLQDKANTLLDHIKQIL